MIPELLLGAPAALYNILKEYKRLMRTILQLMSPVLPVYSLFRLLPQANTKDSTKMNIPSPMRTKGKTTLPMRRTREAIKG